MECGPGPVRPWPGEATVGCSVASPVSSPHASHALQAGKKPLPLVRDVLTSACAVLTKTIQSPFKLRGKQRLFEISNKRYSEMTCSGRGPKSVLIRREREGEFIRRRRGTIVPIEGRTFHWFR